MTPSDPSPSPDRRFRQLRPLLGPKIDALEAAWLTASPQERQEIDIVLAVLRRQATDRWSTLLDPPLTNQADGAIRLGRIRHGRHSLGWLGIDLQELASHVLITGRSGAGKSNLLHTIHLQLMDRGIPWITTDTKRSSRALAALPGRGNIQVLSLGRDFGALLQFNPLYPPRGLDLDTHVRQVVELVCDSYSGGDGVASLLLSAVRACMSKRGAPPTLLEIQQHLRSSALGGRVGQWHITTERILDRLTSGVVGRVLNTRHDSTALEQLRRGHTILELDGLSRQDAALLVQMILRYLNTTMLADTQREQLRLVISLDEAQDIAPRRQGLRESVVEQLARKARETGIGIIASTQEASAISDTITANAFTVVALNSRSRQEITAAAAMLLLDGDGAAMLSSLPIGEAIVRLASRWPRPVHIQIEHIPVPKGQFSDQHVLARYLTGPFARAELDSGVSSHSGVIQSPPAPMVAIPPIPLADARSESPIAISFPHSLPIGTETAVLEKEPLARALLEDIARHPFSGVSQRYDRLGMSRRKGNAARKALEQVGYIRGLAVPVPEGQVLLCELTQQGRAWCLQHRVPLTPVHGGLAHAYWQHRIALFLEERGWVVEREYRLSGHPVDIRAERHGQTVVVEVETGHSDWMLSINRLSSMAGTFGVVLWIDPGSFSRVTRIVANRSVPIVQPRDWEQWYRSSLDVS